MKKENLKKLKKKKLLENNDIFVSFFYKDIIF